MLQDILESLAFALASSLFLHIVIAVMIGCAWFAVCGYMRSRQLDSDYEHVNHPRHRGQYTD